MGEKLSPGLLCPKCAGPGLEVTDSRPGVGYIRRRRLCTCGHRVTTVEVIVEGGNAMAAMAADFQRVFDALSLDRRVLVRQIIRELA